MIASTIPAVAATRRASLQACRAAALADSFAGLPPGVTRWRLAAALRRASGLLALTPAMLQLLEIYIDATHDADWAAGGEPVVIQPLIETAERLGRSERQVRNLEHALAARGLLAWRDSANHRRCGRRDRETGRLLYGHGPSLGPVGARAAEILSLAEQASDERAERRRLRLGIGALRRSLQDVLTTLTDHGAETGDLADRYGALPARLPAHTPLAKLIALRDTLDALRAEALTRLSAVEVAEEKAGGAAIHSRRIPEIPEEDSVNGYRRPEDADPSLPEAETAPAANRSKRSGDAAALPALSQIVEAAGPWFLSMLENRPREWGVLMEASDAVRAAVGIDATTWGRVCRQMGRERAAVAAMLIEHGVMRTEGDRHAAIRRPAAYLDAMARRHRDGALNLSLSVRSLIAKRRRADARPRRSTGLDSAARTEACEAPRDGVAFQQVLWPKADISICTHGQRR